MHPFEELSYEYSKLWQSMVIDPARVGTVRAVATSLIGEMQRYAAVETALGGKVKRQVIAVIHEREAGGSFSGNLANGDPLHSYTTHVPRGRPQVGHPPPFTWEEAAEDALKLDGLDKVASWFIERTCYELELYNGFGPRSQGIHTGYLWAGSNHYTAGKYTSDHKWDPTARDCQLGCMVLLKTMMDIDPSYTLLLLTQSASVDPIPTPKIVPADVGGNDTQWVQETLNKLGAELVVDGSYGRKTRRAIVDFQKKVGIDPDGLVGPITRAALTDNLAKI